MSLILCQTLAYSRFYSTKRSDIKPSDTIVKQTQKTCRRVITKIVRYVIPQDKRSSDLRHLGKPPSHR